MDQCIKYTRFGTAIMFSDKYGHSLIKHADIVNASSLCTFSFKVNDPGAGIVIILISGLLDPVAKVYIFPIHKKVFIKKSHFFKNLPSHHKEGACQNIYFM